MSRPASRLPTLTLKRPPAVSSTAAAKSAPQVKPNPGHVASAEKTAPPAASERRFTIRLDKWTPCTRGALRGFARISVEELGLRIDGIAVSQRADGRWGIMLPGRPLLDSQRNLIRDEQGKPVYVWTLAFCDPKDAEAFEAAVLEVVKVHLAKHEADAEALTLPQDGRS